LLFDSHRFKPAPPADALLFFMTQSNLLRDRFVSDVIADIRRAEKQIEVDTATNRRFVKLGGWLIEAAHFRELWRNLRTDRVSTVVPYFAALPKFRSVMKVLRHWEFFNSVSAPIAADVICVRNNIRTFYLNRPDPFSLKIPKLESGAIKSFQQDVEARERVLKHGLLNVPRIIESDLGGNVPFLTEEIIFGRLSQLPSDAEVLVELMKNPLWRTYEKEGFRFKSVSQTVNIDNHAAILIKTCAGCQWDGEWLPQKDFLRRANEIMSGSGLMTFSYSHGDFGIHNILLTDGSTPYVIDWEHARWMPTVRELYRSIKEVPGVFEAIHQRMDELRAAQPDKPILSFFEQFLVITLQPLLAWGRRGRRDISALEHRKGVEEVLNLANKILLREADCQRGFATSLFSSGLR
jgi:hypothetical protein